MMNDFESLALGETGQPPLDVKVMTGQSELDPTMLLMPQTSKANKILMIMTKNMRTRDSSLNISFIQMLYLTGMPADVTEFLISDAKLIMESTSAGKSTAQKASAMAPSRSEKKILAVAAITLVTVLVPQTFHLFYGSICQYTYHNT